MKNYVAWMSLIAVVVGVFTGFGATMAEQWWSKHESPYVFGLDRSISLAQEKIAGGEMLNELNIWLSSYEELKVDRSYEPVKARVMKLRTDLLAPEASPGATLLKREKVRAQLGTIPLIGAKSFAESHSWWLYLLGGVVYMVGLVGLGVLLVWLLLLWCGAAGNQKPVSTVNSSGGFQGPDHWNRGTYQDEMIAAQVFATSQINEQGRYNYEARRF